MVLISASPRLLQRTNKFIFLLSLAFLTLPQLALAQRGGGGMRGGFGFGVNGAGFRAGYGGRYGRGGGFYGDPFLFADYPETFVQPTPQFVVVEPRPATVSDPVEHRSADPLLIELQGDKYVRVKEGALALENAQAGSISREPTRQSNSSQPAVLVYRDGHREEIPQYAIANGTIYLHGNYWRDGYWTKNVPISSLDVEATLQANQQRGVNFTLPSAPNVVIASF